MSDEIDRYKSVKGESITWNPRPDILVFKVVGHLDKVMGRRFLDIIEKAVEAQRHVYGFVDWAEMTGYDSEVRSMWTQFMASNRSRVSAHILVGSKLVSMGVSVANLALGGTLVGYTSRAMFDAVLRSTKMGLAGVHRK